MTTKCRENFFPTPTEYFLDQAGDLLLDDQVEKSDEKQVELETLLLSVEEEDGSDGDD